MKYTAWNEIVSALSSCEISVCVQAAERLQAEADLSDVPKLLTLLDSKDFFVREAAAWPLAELVGSKVLPELLVAYQRGFDEGHDNDGFSAALLEIPALHPIEVQQALEILVKSSSGSTKSNAEWLLAFCVKPKSKE